MRSLFSLFILALLGLFASTAEAHGPKGTLVLLNQRAETVAVFLDGRSAGAVPPHAETSMRVDSGLHDVLVTGRDGDVAVRQRVKIEPGEVQRLAVAVPTGDLKIINNSGAVLSLSLDGAPAGQLAPGAYTVTRVDAGGHRVSATYRQLGADRLLSESRVVVPARGGEAVVFAPVLSGLVRVENRTGRDADLSIDGQAFGRLPEGASRDVTVSLGKVHFSMSAAGRLLDDATLRVEPYADQVWRAYAPKVGELVVANPLPIAVTLRDSLGHSTVLAAYGRQTLRELPVGTLRLTALRTSGESIAMATVEIRPLETSRWTVPAPQSGLVRVVNQDNRPVTVLVDGRPSATLNPAATVTLDLALGWHRVQILDSRGGVIYDTRLEVDRFSEALLSAGRPATAATHHGADYHSRPGASASAY